MFLLFMGPGILFVLFDVLNPNEFQAVLWVLVIVFGFGVFLLTRQVRNTLFLISEGVGIMAKIADESFWGTGWNTQLKYSFDGKPYTVTLTTCEPIGKAGERIELTIDPQRPDKPIIKEHYVPTEVHSTGQPPVTTEPVPIPKDSICDEQVKWNPSQPDAIDLPLQPDAFNAQKHGGAGFVAGLMAGVIFGSLSNLPFGETTALIVLMSLLGCPAGILHGYRQRRESLERGEFTEYGDFEEKLELGQVDLTTLIRVLKDGKDPTKKVALRAIARFGPNATRAVPAVTAELLKGEPPVAGEITGCEICGKPLTIWNRHFGTQQCRLCGNRLFAAKNGQPNPGTYQLAAEALGAIGLQSNDVVAALRKCSRSKDRGLQEACDRALERIQGSSVQTGP